MGGATILARDRLHDHEAAYTRLFRMLDTGLRAYENPSYGVWGGRNAPDKDAAGAPPLSSFQRVIVTIK